MSRLLAPLIALPKVSSMFWGPFSISFRSESVAMRLELNMLINRLISIKFVVRCASICYYPSFI